MLSLRAAESGVRIDMRTGACRDVRTDVRLGLLWLRSILEWRRGCTCGKRGRHRRGEFGAGNLDRGRQVGEGRADGKAQDEARPVDRDVLRNRGGGCVEMGMHE